MARTRMTDQEKAYYENVDFWRPGALLPEDLTRMGQVAEAIPKDTASLLDVGCGNGAFLEYLRTARPDIRLQGAERSAAALQFVTVDKVQASIDDLPFEDASFDCVTCLEVIEHLPKHVYLAGLRELMRVARRSLIISVPNAQDLTLGQVQCHSCATLFNPDYHLRSYTRESLFELLGTDRFVPREIRQFGDGQEYLFARTITRLKRDRTNRFPQDLPCPACGEVLPGRRGASMAPATSVTSGGGARSVIKAVWPKRHEARWLLAAYERIGAS